MSYYGPSNPTVLSRIIYKAKVLSRRLRFKLVSALNRDILLNLADNIPTFYTRFQRVIEIVAADEPAKIRGREHFRSYRKAGTEPKAHTI